MPVTLMDRMLLVRDATEHRFFEQITRKRASRNMNQLFRDNRSNAPKPSFIDYLIP